MFKPIALASGNRKSQTDLALVYCGEIDPQVEARGYFDALIPAEKLLR